MKIYYEKENFVSSQGKIYFKLDGTFDTIGTEYLWTYGKGVYGIFENEELIYVGYTIKSFVDRFRAHIKCVKENSSVNKMYSYIRKNFEEKRFYMKPLVEIGNKVKLDGDLTLRDIQAIELGFITCFRPQFNIEGVNKKYQLDDIAYEMKDKLFINKKTEIEYEECILNLEIELKKKELELLKKEKENL